MTREAALIQKVSEVSKGTVSDLADYAQEMQMLSQTYIQSILQTMLQNLQEEQYEMLRSYRRLRKAVAKLEKRKKRHLSMNAVSLQAYTKC